MFSTLSCKTSHTFPLTIMGHSQRQALLEATILALVAILLLNLAGTLAAIILQFHTHSSPEKALSEAHNKLSASHIK